MSEKCVINFKENGDIAGVDIKNPNAVTQKDIENVELELFDRQIAEKQAGEKAKRAIEYVNSETAKAGTSKAIWESVAEKWAKENDFWIEDYEEGHTYTTQGGEHLIYTENDNTTTIRKINHDIDDLSDWYKNLVDFNQLFPNTGYEIVGFTRLKKNYYAEGSYNQGIGAKGIFSVVVKQNFIPNKQIITSEEIQNYFEFMGFERLGNSNDYRQDNIILGDLNVDNVIKTADGNYHVIDAYVDIEFQNESSENDYSVPKEVVNLVSNELITGGLVDDVIVMNTEELQEVLRKYDNEDYVKIPNGFYIKSLNEIYLNSDNPNIIETAIHEFSHPYLKWLSKSRNDVYLEGIRLLETHKDEVKKYIDHVKETQPNLNEFHPSFDEEVLAQIIGDNGARLIKSKEQNSIKEWLKEFWNEIKSLLGLSNMSAEEVSNLTLKQFSENALKDISTLNLNTLNVLEKNSFKSFRNKQVSKQNLLNLIKERDVKLAEQEIIKEVLDLEEFNSKKIDYNLFESRVREAILPLRKIITNDFSTYGKFSSEYDTVETIIYDSPVDHSVEGHFEIGSNSAYGHTRVWSDYFNNIYSVAELQSDLFQSKKDVDKIGIKTYDELSLISDNYKKIIDNILQPFTIDIKNNRLDKDNIGKALESKKSYELNNLSELIELKEQYRQLQMNSRNNRDYEYYENLIKDIENKEYSINELNVDDVYSSYLNELSNRNTEVVSNEEMTSFEKQMRQSRKIHKERLVRESIKDASQRGYSKFRLPTPYTISKIEGYIPASIKTGSNILDEVEYEGDLYQITQKIGDKYYINKPSEIIIKTMDEVKNEMRIENPTTIEINKYYLKDYNNYSSVTSKDDIVVLTTGLPIEVDISSEIVNKDNFNISNLRKDIQGVVKSYEDLGKFLNKERGENFKIITDEAGYDWYETSLIDSDKLNGVVAFQMSTNNLNNSELQSPLFNTLKQLPTLSEEQALEIYKQSFSTKLENWEELDLNC